MKDILWTAFADELEKQAGFGAGVRRGISAFRGAPAAATQESQQLQRLIEQGERSRRFRRNALLGVGTLIAAPPLAMGGLGLYGANRALNYADELGLRGPGEPETIGE